MRICDLQSGLGRLQRETKSLQEKWAETRVSWRDQTCREFEQKYLEPLMPELKTGPGRGLRVPGTAP